MSYAENNNESNVSGSIEGPKSAITLYHNPLFVFTASRSHSFSNDGRSWGYVNTFDPLNQLSKQDLFSPEAKSNITSSSSITSSLIAQNYNEEAQTKASWSDIDEDEPSKSKKGVDLYELFKESNIVNISEHDGSDDENLDEKVDNSCE